MPKLWRENPLTIEHSWTFPYTDASAKQIYSSYFTCTEFLGVKFKILCEVINDHEVFAIVSKTSSIPAHANISILVNESTRKQVEVSDWETHCIIGNEIDFFDTTNLCTSVESTRVGVIYQCQISWYGFVDEISSSQSDGLYSHTKYLLDTLDFSDIVITVNGEKIPAHQVIIGVQSPVFAKMFKINMIESASNRVDIKDIDIDIMRKVIEFMYTGKLDATLDVDTLFPMLAAADKYQITDLKNLCEKILITKITIDTALKILEEANLYDLSQLIEKTMTFMVKNKKILVQLNDFKSLRSKKPELFREFFRRMAMEKIQT